VRASPGNTDRDGNARIDSGTVDVGAYEFQGFAAFLAWLQFYGLPTDGSAGFTDPDHDDLNNWQEWRAGTDPTNTLSTLRMLSALPGGSGVTVSWQSAASRSYFLQRATNLAAPLVFLTVQSNLAGNAGTTSYTDTTASGRGPFYYRVGLQ
jgi:hypothetical protein